MDLENKNLNEKKVVRKKEGEKGKKEAEEVDRSREERENSRSVEKGERRKREEALGLKRHVE